MGSFCFVQREPNITYRIIHWMPICYFLLAVTYNFIISGDENVFPEYYWRKPTEVADRLCIMNTRTELDLLFLGDVIDRHNVQKRDATKCENHKFRNSTFKYHVFIRDWHAEVCRNAFSLQAVTKKLVKRHMSSKPEWQSPVDIWG